MPSNPSKTREGNLTSCRNGVKKMATESYECHLAVVLSLIENRGWFPKRCYLALITAGVHGDGFENMYVNKVKVEASIPPK